MRFNRVLTVFIVVLSFILSSCAGGGSLADRLAGRGVPADGAAWKAELRYLRKSRGANYMAADMSGDAAFLSGMLEAVQAAKPAEKPQEEKYAPELVSYCEIVLSGAGGAAVSLYYDGDRNLLVYPERRQSGEKTTLRYLYFTPGEGLKALLEAGEAGAKPLETNEAKPFRNIEELKSSIDDDELIDEATDIEWEFFTDATPEYTGTACRVYTAAQFAGVPEDSYLITVYCKSKTGEQMKLAVQGMAVNAYYTKVLIAEPDEALDSVDAEEAPDAFAVVVKKEAIDPAKWIVFVDEDNIIYDVVVPEDIEGMATPGPQGTAAPGGSAEPTATVDPYAGGGD